VNGHVHEIAGSQAEKPEVERHLNGLAAVRFRPMATVIERGQNFLR
jgi:hypothetical protein